MGLDSQTMEIPSSPDSSFMFGSTGACSHAALLRQFKKKMGGGGAVVSIRPVVLPDSVLNMQSTQSSLLLKPVSHWILTF